MAGEFRESMWITGVVSADDPALAYNGDETMPGRKPE
jgi:hypothetical protein